MYVLFWQDFDANGNEKEYEPEKEKTYDEIRIAGIIFEHGKNDYGLWEGFNLSKEDENAIQQILMKYDTEGCSTRGTMKEISMELGR